ncbi:MAG: hypothetical protein LBI39_03840 [Puniceicoccales bacterium]|nr:hypothetical protein [Puniceicoccales bacterium]
MAKNHFPKSIAFSPLCGNIKKMESFGGSQESVAVGEMLPSTTPAVGHYESLRGQITDALAAAAKSNLTNVNSAIAKAVFRDNPEKLGELVTKYLPLVRLGFFALATILSPLIILVGVICGAGQMFRCAMADTPDDDIGFVRKQALWALILPLTLFASMAVGCVSPTTSVRMLASCIPLTSGDFDKICGMIPLCDIANSFTEKVDKLVARFFPGQPNEAKRFKEIILSHAITWGDLFEEYFSQIHGLLLGDKNAIDELFAALHRNLDAVTIERALRGGCDEICLRKIGGAVCNHLVCMAVDMEKKRKDANGFGLCVRNIFFELLFPDKYCSAFREGAARFLEAEFTNVALRASADRIETELPRDQNTARQFVDALRKREVAELAASGFRSGDPAIFSQAIFSATAQYNAGDSILCEEVNYAVDRLVNYGAIDSSGNLPPKGRRSYIFVSNCNLGLDNDKTKELAERLSRVMDGDTFAGHDVDVFLGAIREIRRAAPKDKQTSLLEELDKTAKGIEQSKDEAKKRKSGFSAAKQQLKAYASTVAQEILDNSQAMLLAKATVAFIRNPSSP